MLVCAPSWAGADGSASAINVASGFSRKAFVRGVDRMMVTLAPQNAETSAAVRELYHDYLDLLVLDEYGDLQDALGNGGLVPLPPNPLRFNVLPRTAGLHPIGEMDIDNQASYLAARPATIGCLLDVASRIVSGPIEVTSLVRHADYQEELRTTNANAITAVPMHTMGLAFDIALVNTPLERAQEVLGVLEQMRDAGDILFIGERKQLVFHVVPHPSRLGYFTDIYSRALALPDDTLPGAHPLSLSAIAPPRAMSASVSAEIIDVRPTAEFADAWWAAIDPGGDLTFKVADQPAGHQGRRSGFHVIATTLLGSLAAAVLLFRVTQQQPAGPRHDDHEGNWLVPP